MFIEINSANGTTGWLEVICGSMFSGKTEELIRRLRRAQIANQRVEIFKPRIDNRYSDADIVSHNRSAIRCTPVSSTQELYLQADGVEVVGIDEAQFFDENLPEIARKLANGGSRVIVAGLDMDYLGQPFGPMPELLAEAEFITKVHAICQQCGSLANYSYRHQSEKSRVLIGEKDTYEPRCRKCFLDGMEGRAGGSDFRQRRLSHED